MRARVGLRHRNRPRGPTPAGEGGLGLAMGVGVAGGAKGLSYLVRGASCQHPLCGAVGVILHFLQLDECQGAQVKVLPRGARGARGSGREGEQVPGRPAHEVAEKEPRRQKGRGAAGWGELAGNVPAQWGFSLMLPAVIYFPFKSEMSL